MFSKSRQKVISLIFLATILISLIFPWFGRARGIQVIKGIILFHNPIAVIFLLLIIVGVLIKKEEYYLLLMMLGFLGLFGIAMWEFLTWENLGLVGTIDVMKSFQKTYPEFFVSLLLIVAAAGYNVACYIRLNI